MSFEILDPTHEDQGRTFQLAPRLTALDGATVAIISNGKKGTRPFFDAVEERLVTQHGVASVVRLVKSNYSAPVESGLLSEAARWHALVAGVGD